MTITRVGLIGAGLMGHGIGKNILAKGYELSVMAHHNRAPVDDLIAKGAPESILEVSTSYEINGQQKMLDAATRELCNATFNSLSRVIASLASPSGKFQPNTPHIFQLMRRVNLSFWVSQRFLIRPKNLSRLHCTHCNGMVSKLKC